MWNLKPGRRRNLNNFPFQDSKAFHPRCLLAAFKKELKSQADSKKWRLLSLQSHGSQVQVRMYEDFSIACPKLPTPGRITLSAFNKVCGSRVTVCFFPKIMKCFFYTFNISGIIVNYCNHVILLMSLSVFLIMVIQGFPDHMSDRNKISDQNAPIQYNPKTDSCKVLSLLLPVFIPVILPVTVHSVNSNRISYHCLQSRVNQNSTPLS